MGRRYVPEPVSATVEDDYWIARHFGRLLGELMESDRDVSWAEASRLDSWPERLTLAEETVGKTLGTETVERVLEELPYGGRVQGVEATDRELARFESGDFRSTFTIESRLRRAESY